MTSTSLTDSRSYLSYDLSFLPHLDPDNLDAAPLRAMRLLNQKYTSLKYQSMGISSMTRGQSVEPVLSIRRIVDNINNSPGYLGSSYIKKMLKDSTTSQTASIDRSSPYYIKIMTKDYKTAIAGRVMDVNTARVYFKMRAVPEAWLNTYGQETTEQMILLEFPQLGRAEKLEEGTYSKLEATAALVQSCIQHSLELFDTSYIKAIPVEQNTAGILSMLGFSYATFEDRDTSHFLVTPETEMILFPEVREVWKQQIRQNPIRMPPSLLTSNEEY